jgi:hypothetical protein
MRILRICNKSSSDEVHLDVWWLIKMLVAKMIKEEKRKVQNFFF